MKDIKLHKDGMGFLAWQRAAIRRRGQYGDRLTIEQLRADTRIPPNVFSDEKLTKAAQIHQEGLTKMAPAAPLALVNEATVLVLGYLWEGYGEVVDEALSDPEELAHAMEESGAAYLIFPYTPDDEEGAL